MSKKLTYEFVKEGFEKEGYTLLSDKYNNNYTKLNYICSEEHRHSIRWGDWSRGRRCPTCDGQTKPTLNMVIKSFEKEGYTLLSKEYINSHVKLYYCCLIGHRHNMRWFSWQQGHRCPTCDGQTKPTFKQVRESFEQEGYVLLSKEYVNNKTTLYYKCSNYHMSNITWTDWQAGHRCSICSVIKNTGSGHYNWQGGISYEPYCEIWKDKEYKNDIKERDGYRCLNPYCYSKHPNDLNIHHIDYNKKNCHPSNLITVCRTCNISANSDRDWHQTWYQAIVKNRYYS